MTDIQNQLQEAIDELVESGAERGLQVAVYRHGEQVADAVAGVGDPETGRPVESDTPFYCYSVGKGAASTVAHVLVERGLFGYDTPVVNLWTEFGAHGKEAATVRHVLTHTVGVPGILADTTPEDLCDWDKMCSAIAEAEPWWEPGTKIAYHAYPFGYMVREIVHRTTGKPISQVLREEVAVPLGIADEIYCGVPESELGRLARLEDMEGSAEMLASMPDDSPFFKGTDVTENHANLPRVVLRDEWTAARKELLAREKQFTRQRDALSADRRRLPMVRIEKEYVFEGPEGKARLIDLFEGRHQLIVGHFMFDPR